MAFISVRKSLFGVDTLRFIGCICWLGMAPVAPVPRGIGIAEGAMLMGLQKFPLGGHFRSAKSAGFRYGSDRVLNWQTGRARPEVAMMTACQRRVISEL
jgi:hypothetical protein